ncbi:KpsF/GutQ family sugar-phosphate isomerase [Vibrio porteresiae]|uniref:Arabinose 5-phosphate isomerase n=1 Tax=Vibrio porteresiae DSM 19223 TaxID=1123496 RepID=A0ABZ0QCV2_9VIBR|nr:KpsF/GutQ family sugar-phosphate isomerase [Vibrio porteresiae]WPC74288.1 KpsF/GutQ family sugar-phosphate isomerase [Vibrio porteresiae DSM 19223]
MNILETARDVIMAEIAGLQQMEQRLDNEFVRAVDAILSTDGRTIICGMGKSGIIGRKIAASFASTGTPSFFMHPGEAFHGDLGMVKSEDVVIAISNSGETEEVLKLLPFFRDNKNLIVSITGNKNSTLAKNSHYHLDISVPKEACPYQLAPTSSTTATLVMGDALTVALMELRDFQPENFARFHPGGSLGKRLLSKVEDEMKTDILPFVNSQTLFKEIVQSMTHGKLGLAIVKAEDKIGIITDGDLRRAMDRYGKDVFDISAGYIASFSPVTIEYGTQIGIALEKMEVHNISSLLVIKDKCVVGVLKK